MYYSLKSLEGGYIGDNIGNYPRGYYGDTRSLIRLRLICLRARIPRSSEFRQ